ncbi:hypothetical protein [Desulfosporosinus sp. BG]|uniref:hypothetical protein n=1 Tax=Desulfosporosinus sp. BG TaxID=1633135 RepID=UPI00083B458B|nr:hypothetical protein [Desulfosporosinus sp. BG]ODA39229.1 hypothetical protein DSBG_3975 [Desulfosporosinus sp. BG]
MDRIKGEIMSKDAFFNNVPYTKEPYEGILISADTEHNQYKIAVQLSENQVLLVDQVNDKEVHEKLREWVPRVNEIQIQYGVKNDPGNYS